MWWAKIVPGSFHDDEYFNMDKWTTESPQYTLQTPHGAYTINFEKNESNNKEVSDFKLVLSKSDKIP